MAYNPIFSISPQLANTLITLAGLKRDVELLPMTSNILKSLRSSAALESVHYSTYIEGNRLTLPEIKAVISEDKRFVGKERDEKEILGYYTAFAYMESLVKEQQITETQIKTIHGLLMAGGKKRALPTPYRDGQNVIRDGQTHRIVYLPPEAQDVPALMRDLVDWIKTAEREQLPAPLIAAIAHYQFATIHPYYDGNGRTARLLPTLVLHKNGYSLKGIYSLDEYYAKDLPAYYEALNIGNSHNYYLGRIDADISSWIEYFCNGMLYSLQKIKEHATRAVARKETDAAKTLQMYDKRQRLIIAQLKDHPFITSHDVAKVLKIQPRTARALCQQWVDAGFFEVINPAKKNRLYALSSK